MPARAPDSSFADEVTAALKAVRPALRADGGDIELVSADRLSGRVEVRLVGACKGCPAASMTMTYAVEASLRRAVPDIRDVVAL